MFSVTLTFKFTGSHQTHDSLQYTHMSHVTCHLFNPSYNIQTFKLFSHEQHTTHDSTHLLPLRPIPYYVQYYYVQVVQSRPIQSHDSQVLTCHLFDSPFTCKSLWYARAETSKFYFIIFWTLISLLSPSQKCMRKRYDTCDIEQGDDKAQVKVRFPFPVGRVHRLLKKDNYAQHFRVHHLLKKGNYAQRVSVRAPGKCYLTCLFSSTKKFFSISLPLHRPRTPCCRESWACRFRQCCPW